MGMALEFEGSVWRGPMHREAVLVHGMGMGSQLTRLMWVSAGLSSHRKGGGVMRAYDGAVEGRRLVTGMVVEGMEWTNVVVVVDWMMRMK